MSFVFVCQSCGYSWNEDYNEAVFVHAEGDCPCCDEPCLAAGHRG